MRTASARRGAWHLSGVIRSCAVALAALAFTAPVLRAQWSGDASVILGQMEHRVDAGYGVASSTGTVLGVGAVLRGWRLLEVDARVLGGRLAGDTVARTDRRLGQVGLRLNLLPLPWLAVGASAEMRGYDATTSTQHWTLLGAGAELRLDFAGGDVRSVIRTTLLPRVSLSGQGDPDLGIAAAAGLEAARGRFVAGLDYSLERYVFPPDPLGGTRREQLSGLLVRVGTRW